MSTSDHDQLAGLDDRAVLAPAPQLLSSRMGEETAILNLQTGVYLGLNPVATRVWELVQERMDVGTIRHTILGEFKVEPDVLERDLREVLASMHSHGLLTR